MGSWIISPSVEGGGGWISSPAVALCPASGRAGHSDRFGLKGWEFGDKDGKNVAGNITVTCSSHSYRD